MSDPRGSHGLGAYPKARFRCLVCRRFVTATERGVCPGCGRAPPVLTESPRRDPRPRPRPARASRSRAALGWLAVAAMIAAVVAALALAV